MMLIQTFCKTKITMGEKISTIVELTENEIEKDYLNICFNSMQNAKVVSPKVALSYVIQLLT